MALNGNVAGKLLRGRINSIDMLILSAYALAVKNGFKGTEEEWLASLKGDKGDKGEPGDAFEAPPIVCDSKGELIEVKDSAERQLHGLTLYGKTTQNGTPAPESPVPLESVGSDGSVEVFVSGKNLLPFPYVPDNPNMGTGTYQGITIVDNLDGSITINGTATAKRYFQFNYFRFYKAGTYTLSFNTDNTDIMGGLAIEGGGAAYITNTVRTATLKLKEDGYMRAYLTVNSGAVLNNVKVYPQLERGNTATEYEPYNGGALTASTPNGLPGIPVSSGGNYTDESGQQWICDEVDFAKGVYVQRTLEAVYDGSDDESWTLVASNDYGITTFGITNTNHKAHTGMSNMLKLMPGTTTSSTATEEGFRGNGYWLYCYISTERAGTVDAFRSLLSSTNLQVLFALEPPTETPLSAEELAAYAALHTNKPYTTVYNDGGAGMALEYVADTKNYIDQKLAAISAAMLNV